MSKQWTCNDCVVKDTDACYYGNPMLTDFKCDKRIVDVDYAYQQGRADAIDECIKAIKESESIFDNHIRWTMAEKNRMINSLMRLKEQKNEN